jgi:hypothetical protein
MIKLDRTRTQTSVHATFYGQKRLELALTLLETQRRIARQEITKHDFDDTVWKKAKNILVKESEGKCAYCETPFTVVAYGDVEHYRPKSVYWWLAYCYDNYLPACQMCNQKFKKDSFPIKNAAMKAPAVMKNMTDTKLKSLASKLYADPFDAKAVQAFVKLHKKERPWLLNPYVDNPEAYLAWQADDTLREVEVIPAEGVSNAKKVCEAAIKFYGLNRTELKTLRYKIFKYFRVLKKAVQKVTIANADKKDFLVEIEDMKRSDAPFAAMVRYFDTLL